MFPSLTRYTVDMTMKATLQVRATGEATNASVSSQASSSSSANQSTADLFAAAEQGLPIQPHSVPISVRSVVSGGGDLDGTEGAAQPPSVNSATSNFTYIKQTAGKLLNAVTPEIVKDVPEQQAPLHAELETLVEAYASSDIAKTIESEMKALQDDVARSNSAGGVVSNEPVDAVLETSLLRGRKRATWGTQFRILSGRAFKNLYRDPALLAAHYISAVALACKSLLFNVLRSQMLMMC